MKKTHNNHELLRINRTSISRVFENNEIEQAKNAKTKRKIKVVNSFLNAFLVNCQKSEIKTRKTKVTNSAERIE